MIVDRVTRYLESCNGVIPDKVMEVAQGSFGHSLQRNLASNRDVEERKPSISPSGPWYCPRRFHYKLTSAPKEDLQWRSRLAFLLGDTVEAIAIVLMRLAGVPMLSPNEDGLQLRVHATLGGIEIAGSIDASVKYAGHGEIPVDVKSMSAYSFADFQRACTDPGHAWWHKQRFDNVFQVRLYKRMMKEMGLSDGQHGILVGVNKNTGHLAEAWVNPHDDDKLIDRAVAKVALHHASGKVPDRPAWAKAIEMPGANLLPDGTKGPCLQIDTDKQRTGDHGWRCSYCPYTEVCWPGFEVVPLSKPVYRKPIQAQEAVTAGKADDGLDRE